MSCCACLHISCSISKADLEIIRASSSDISTSSVEKLHYSTIINIVTAKFAWDNIPPPQKKSLPPTFTNTLGAWLTPALCSWQLDLV